MTQSWPIVETTRLYIEPFTEEHLGARYVSWLNDPNVVRYSEQRHKSHTGETCRDFLRSFEDSHNQFWAIVTRDRTFGHVGNISAYVDVVNLTANIAIMIGETSVRGLGFGSEAFGAVSAYMIRDRGMRKVTAGTMSVNEPMLKVMKNLAMEPDGRRKDHVIFEDHPVDLIYAALFAPPEGS